MCYNIRTDGFTRRSNKKRRDWLPGPPYCSPYLLIVLCASQPRTGRGYFLFSLTGEERLHDFAFGIFNFRLIEEMPIFEK
jgi:hypothetical protein